MASSPRTSSLRAGCRRPSWLGFLRGLAGGALNAFIPVLMLVLLQMATRRERLGWILWWPLAALAFGARGSLSSWVIGAASAALFAFLLVRAGLVGAIVACAVFAIFNEAFLTTQLGAWYANMTFAGLLTLAALLLWGVSAATRGSRTAAQA